MMRNCDIYVVPNQHSMLVCNSAFGMCNRLNCLWNLMIDHLLKDRTDNRLCNHNVTTIYIQRDKNCFELR